MRARTIFIVLAFILAALALVLNLRLRTGSPLKTVQQGVKLEQLEVGGISRATLAELVLWLSPAWYMPPANASVDHATGRIIRGRVGQKVDVEKTVEALLSAPPGRTISPELDRIEPRWRRADLTGLTPVSRFSTIVTGDANRIDNLNLAVSLLNNTLILPGKTFSFNAIAGPYSKARGYLEAPVIIGNEFGIGVAGGVCQLSSTLYQAILPLGIKILERHGHTLPVPYLKPGEDATVADSKDFRFENNLSTPIIIKAFLKGDTLNVVILGKP